MHARIHLRFVPSAFPVAMEAGAILTIDGPFRREGDADFIAMDARRDEVMHAIASLGLLLMRNSDSVDALGIKVSFGGREQPKTRSGPACSVRPEPVGEGASRDRRGRESDLSCAAG